MALLILGWVAGVMLINIWFAQKQVECDLKTYSQCQLITITQGGNK